MLKRILFVYFSYECKYNKYTMIIIYFKGKLRNFVCKDIRCVANFFTRTSQSEMLFNSIVPRESKVN